MPVDAAQHLREPIPLGVAEFGSGLGVRHHFAVTRGGIEVGATIDSDVTPIIWPRPDGDLPPTPKVPFTLPAGIANSGATPAS